MALSVASCCLEHLWDYFWWWHGGLLYILPHGAATLSISGQPRERAEEMMARGIYWLGRHTSGHLLFLVWGILTAKKVKDFSSLPLAPTSFLIWLHHYYSSYAHTQPQDASGLTKVPVAVLLPQQYLKFQSPSSFYFKENPTLESSYSSKSSFIRELLRSHGSICSYYVLFIMGYWKQ